MLDDVAWLFYFLRVGLKNVFQYKYIIC